MNRFAKITSLAIASAMLLSLSSCGKGTTSAPVVSDSAVSAPISSNAHEVNRIALVTFSATVSDESFNQGTWEGIKSFAGTHGIHADFYQPSADTYQARVRSINSAIKEGANIIVVPGYAFAPLMETLPNEHPEILFIALDVDPSVDMNCEEPPSNLYCITFAEEQSGYLAGYAAVKDGYTKLGFLGGQAIPSVVRYGQGYIQGIDAAAQELKRPVEVRYTYAGQFNGSFEISDHMSEWYRDGTQVIFSCGGAIWVSPAQAAMYYNGMVIGVDTDQHHLGEDLNKYSYNPFISSATKAMGKATEDALELACSDQFASIGGTWKVLSLSDGDYVGLPTEGNSWGFQSFSIPAYERVRDKIASGKIVVDNTSTPDFRFPTSSYTTVDYDA